jgi:hypothetical protein
MVTAQAERGEIERLPNLTLLATILPTYEFRGAVSVRIRATPREIFRAADAVSLADMPLARALGTLRYLPYRLRGRKPERANESRSFIHNVLPEAGNIVLARDPDRELVIGAIGKFHQLSDQQPVHLTDASAFAAFDDPAYQKLAMAIRVGAGDATKGYTLTLEHRTHALGPEARRGFRRYWIAIKPGGNFVSWLLLRAIKRLAEREHAAEGGG